MTDAEFTAAVAKAVQDRVSPADVEARVGQRPWINTTRPGDRDAYVLATIDLDPQEQSQIASLVGTDIAYWGRPVPPDPANNPRIVGIVWQSDGSSRLFYGILYPP